MKVFRNLIMGYSLSLFVFAPVSARDLNISGLYSVNGLNPDGSGYSGYACIEESSSVVHISWSIPGSPEYIGNGKLEDRILSVDWGDDFPVIYVIMADGELHGTWADGWAAERLSREKGENKVCSPTG